MLQGLLQSGIWHWLSDYIPLIPVLLRIGDSVRFLSETSSKEIFRKCWSTWCGTNRPSAWGNSLCSLWENVVLVNDPYLDWNLQRNWPHLCVHILKPILYWDVYLQLVNFSLDGLEFVWKESSMFVLTFVCNHIRNLLWLVIGYKQTILYLSFGVIWVEGYSWLVENYYFQGFFYKHLLWYI